MRHALFDDSINVKGRLLVADRFPHRADICRHAGSLIAWQDGEIAAAEVGLTRRDRALGRYMARVMGDPDFPEAERAPVGTKLPPLYFSPLYHFDRALRGRMLHWTYDATVLPYLPRTLAELEEYLQEAVLGALSENEMFEKTTGVTVRSIAEFLFAIRKSHPALFLLLLSFEIEEVRGRMPSLDYTGGRGEASEWRTEYFAGADCSILALFEIIRILRRGTAIIDALSKRRRFDVNHLRALCARLRKGSRSPADKALLEDANLSVLALRKVVLIDIDRHDDPGLAPYRHRFRRRRTNAGTLLASVCMVGTDTEYAAEVLEDYITQATLNLPIAGPPPAKPRNESAIEVARIKGAGGSQPERLATFYGFDANEVATLVAIEVGAIAGKRATKSKTAALANALLFKLWVEDAGAVRCVHIDRMVKMAELAFPGQGCFRHACGFARSSWQDLEADASRWRLLTEAGEAAEPYAELFLATRRYLHAFSYDLVRLKHLDEAARIFCHLANSDGLLARDPLWIRLLHRAKIAARINVTNTRAANDRGAMFGPGPRSLDELARSIR